MTNKTNTVEEQIVKILTDHAVFIASKARIGKSRSETKSRLLSLFNQYADERFKRALPERVFKDGERANKGGFSKNDFMTGHNQAIDEMKSRWEEESK